MTEAFLPEGYINVLEALPVWADCFEGEARHGLVDVARGLVDGRGLAVPETCRQKWRRRRLLESGVLHCEG